MHLVFDIFQGLGIAAAVGIRPFLPTLVVGALAAGDIQIDFEHTSLSFLQSGIFLLVMVLGVIAVAVLERRAHGQESRSRAVQYGLAAIALALGALLFGGAIAQHHHPVVIGVIAGVIGAAIGLLATQPLLSRVRARLGGDADAAGALPLIVEAVATVGAALSVLAPPVGVILLLALLVLALRTRSRGEQKYAGLRILR